MHARQAWAAGWQIPPAVLVAALVGIAAVLSSRVSERLRIPAPAYFHSSLASLAELVAFVMLGLTIQLYALPHGGAWLIGLALAALLAFIIRQGRLEPALGDTVLHADDEVVVLAADADEARLRALFSQPA
jgi:NhaP-type Na+/H+ and K+/H+ antiporter